MAKKVGTISSGLFLLILGVILFLDIFLNLPFQAYKIWPILIIFLGIEIIISKADNFTNLRFNLPAIIVAFLFVFLSYLYYFSNSFISDLKNWFWPNNSNIEWNQEYTPSKPVAITEDIKSISVNVDSSSIIISRTSNDTILISKSSNISNDKYFKVSVEDKTLNISQFKNIPKEIQKNSKLIIYLPQNYKLDDIDVKTNLGSIEIKGIISNNINLVTNLGQVKVIDTKGNKIDISTDMGAININNCSIQNVLKAHTNMGSIDLYGDVDNSRIIAKTNLGSVKLSKSSGYFKGKTIEKVFGNGLLEINLSTDMGSISIKDK
ncbi:DUF4097 family beta strand repeat-containing protein [Caldicellulosiruptoraceae bacterium PP1]